MLQTFWLQQREEKAQIASHFFFLNEETHYPNLQQGAKFNRMAFCLIPAKTSNPQQHEL